MAILQIETQGLLDELGDTEQVNTVAIHVPSERVPLLHHLIAIAEQHVLFGKVRLQHELNCVRHVIVIEVCISKTYFARSR